MSYNVTYFLNMHQCLPTLSPDKIKDKVLNRIYKACCLHGLATRHGASNMLGVYLFPQLGLLSLAGRPHSTAPPGKTLGFLQAQSQYHLLLEASPGRSV